MERPFEKELVSLKQKLLTMASHAEAALNLAVRALLERNDELALKVEEDDSIIDQFEKELDELAIDFLALKAPVASDLRLITVTMKCSNELERVGDESTTIARRVIKLNSEPALKTSNAVPEMASIVAGMLKQSLHSFVNGDLQTAMANIRRDKEVDELNKDFQLQLAEYMAANPSIINRALHWMVISKCMERIGDHATNIAEEVVFLYEAKDIRHQQRKTETTNPIESQGNEETDHTDSR
ncbi:MAG: phosphate signaling complex protein PhoU [Verrucomicrobia bacterium]|nr:phosphate signaling complex protein PhoU [Verrucomicrobiota bacterium]MCF7708378.1 phosphate signaling complex protein PhoU [Verrucomicrobiota bacterium]